MTGNYVTCSYCFKQVNKYKFHHHQTSKSCSLGIYDLFYEDPLKKRARQWYYNNTERHAAYMHAYRQINKEKIANKRKTKNYNDKIIRLNNMVSCSYCRKMMDDIVLKEHMKEKCILRPNTSVTPNKIPIY